MRGFSEVAKLAAFIAAAVVMFLIINQYFVNAPYNHELILKYLKIILAWPFIILVLGLIFLFKFAPSISALISSGLHASFGKAEVEFPGGQPFQSFEAEDEDLSGRLAVAEEEALGTEYIVEERAEREKLVLREFLEFERIIRLMFRSQYYLLQKLRKEGLLPYYGGLDFYTLYMKSGGVPSYTYENYIGWIAGTKLLEIVGEGAARQMVITDRGEFFLDYCEDMKYSESEWRPF